MFNHDEIFWLFAQDESYQGDFFPATKANFHLASDDFDLSTTSARLAAFGILTETARKSSAGNTAKEGIYREIWSLGKLMLEFSTIYPWIFCHPFEKDAFAGVLDPTIYGVWDVIRRLCRDVSTMSDTKEIESFWKMFSEFVVEY